MSIPQRKDSGEHLDAFKLINMSFAVKQAQSESWLSALPSASKTGKASGRMYDPVVARFLSPDPLIQFPENSQSYNSYSYVLNNPLRFTDPSGFMVDWFINELSGDVYYNSAYKKGDETKIEGEGWTHFAENGKLSEKSSDDFALLWSNKELWDDYKERSETSYNSKGEKVSSFGVEALFKGNNAKEFMSRQGQVFKPKDVLEEIDTENAHIPTLGIGDGGKVLNKTGSRLILTSQYVLQGSIEETDNIKVLKSTERPGGYTIISRSKLSYYGPNWFQKTLIFLRDIQDPSRNDVKSYDLNNYPSDGILRDYLNQ